MILFPMFNVTHPTSIHNNNNNNDFTVNTGWYTEMIFIIHEMSDR